MGVRLEHFLPDWDRPQARIWGLIKYQSAKSAVIEGL